MRRVYIHVLFNAAADNLLVSSLYRNSSLNGRIQDVT